MANQEHLSVLKQGVKAWNQWRIEHPDVQPDLEGAQLIGWNLPGINLSETNLVQANCDYANLFQAKLNRTSLKQARLTQTNLSWSYSRSGADFTRANLTRADLSGASLIGTKMIETNMTGARLIGADFRGADLSKANLTGAFLISVRFVGTNLKEATLNNCAIYGIAVWDVNLEGTVQQDLVISRDGEPFITVDNLEVAQFIYLLLNNQKIREVIDTVSKKAVLILGRFTPERKAVLNAIREELRKLNYLPILFDFDLPESRDVTETVTLLARMARFIIADLTEPSSIPQELQAIVPHVAVPVQPLLEGDRSYSMFRDLRKYDWVLQLHRYAGLDSLIASLQEKVIAPAEAKAELLIYERNH